MENRVVAHIDAHVAGVPDEVARLCLGQRDGREVGHLGIGGVWQRDASCGIGAHREAGAVIAGSRGAAPHVRRTKRAIGIAQDSGALCAREAAR